MQSQSPWASTAETAKYLRISERTLLRWRDAGMLEPGVHYRFKFPSQNSPILYNLLACDAAINKLSASAANLKLKNNDKSFAGKVWGVWTFDAESLTLKHKGMAYTCDLSEINSTAQLLDWIFQIHSKNKHLWGETATADLLAAFRDIFNPQANCCSWGQEKEFNGKALATAFANKYV